MFTYIVVFTFIILQETEDLIYISYINNTCIIYYILGLTFKCVCVCVCVCVYVCVYDNNIYSYFSLKSREEKRPDETSSQCGTEVWDCLWTHSSMIVTNSSVQWAS